MLRAYGHPSGCSNRTIFSRTVGELESQTFSLTRNPFEVGE